jgi:hypothetical protein
MPNYPKLTFPGFPDAAVSTVTYWLRSMRQCSGATIAVRMFLYCSLSCMLRQTRNSHSCRRLWLYDSPDKKGTVSSSLENVTDHSPCLPPTGTAHPARGQGNYVQYLTVMSYQKSAELLFSIPPTKHTLAELLHGIAHAVHVRKMFELLVSDLASIQP